MAAYDGTTITFCGVVIARHELTDTLPYPTYKCRVKEHFMTEGGEGPGLRVLELLGAHVSYSDFEFQADLLTPADVITFETEFFDQRTVKTLTFTVPINDDPGDDEITSYHCLFQENGLSITPQDANVEYDEVYKGIFRVHILNKIAGS